ncbi:MAG TPA: ATP-dependent helicase HrpB [Vicinamibacteria bacterium]|nr:ATP-dependent helicase HrpB [Vicinamibacteria bacterium]
MRPALPIDAHVARVREVLARSRAAVLVAPPGSGKTTRVPPALTAGGPVFLLQPRRVAARSIARRIAEEQGWTLGREVGWQVRFERRFGPDTRLLVATEGILTRRLQSDPLLDGFRTIVLDEFHERSLHADLALAFARQAWRAREDLRLLVMSATLDAGPVASFLDECPVMEVPGRPHPIEVGYEAGATPAAAVRAALARPGRHVLCFLPGAPEIRKVRAELGEVAGARVLPLHGSLSSEEQDLALAPSEERKVILATNVAETSLTVDGVTDVIDSGQHKVLRYDPSRGLDRLDLERIPADSAEQRAGRAGRTGPGRVLRLWDERDRLRPRREPEIERVDLAGPLLDVLAWGGDPARFEWFEAPPPQGVSAAMDRLERLSAGSGGRLTPEGEAMHRLPLHPRLARVLLAAGGGARAAAACAVLGEGWRPVVSGDAPTTDSDVLSAADRIREAPPGVRAAARELSVLGERVGPRREGPDDEESLLRALLAGFPDRVARRREPGSSRLVLASGQGALLGRESGVREGDLLLALEVTAGAAGAGGESLVRVASRVERSWLEGVRTETVHRFDEASASVRAFAQDLYDRLLLGERAVPPDPDAAADLLAAALERRGLGEAGEALRRRLRFAGLEADLHAAVLEACRGRASLPSLDDPDRWLGAAARGRLDRLAPERLPLPSGRTAALDYREDGSVVAAAKLQELFGLAETPRIGPGRVPVVFELLAPNGRPVQTTRDLRSFWERTYPEVRRELRARYPRHPWPEDPWAAEPTHRTTRRPR